MIRRHIHAGLTLFLLQAILAPAAASAADTPPLVANGGFEQGQGQVPEGWTHRNSRSAVFRWEPAGGIGGSRCISITIPNRGADVAWTQKLKLEPRTAYILRGMIKGENIAVVQKDGKIGANLCQMGVWGCSSDPHQSTGTFDWRRFQVDFCTGESGEVEVGCRLGHWGSVASGKAWFDNLDLVKNAAMRRYEGQHVYLILNVQIKEKIGWEPFKKTFRYFHSLPRDQRPRTPWQQFELFYNKLREFSGVDVWTFFSPEDIQRLKQQYPDSDR